MGHGVVDDDDGLMGGHGRSVEEAVHATEEESAPSSSFERRREELRLDHISAELMSRYQNLHTAQVTIMKDFYLKLQNRLDFISEPSRTPEDSRAKQAVAQKLMRVLRQEEHKITSRSGLTLTWL